MENEKEEKRKTVNIRSDILFKEWLNEIKEKYWNEKRLIPSDADITGQLTIQFKGKFLIDYDYSHDDS